MTLDLAGPLSTTDWVKQSRLKETSDKNNALRLAELQKRRLDEEEEDYIAQASAYSSSDLKGLRVKHGDSDFETGQHVILTLADSDLLEMDDQGKAIGINEDSDVLENVNFADTDRRLERENRVKRNRQPIYSALDDAEFADGVVPGTRGPLLAQYEKEKKAAPKMLLGENGIVVSERVKTVDTATNNFGSVHSLLSQIKTASDYLTVKETATFHKRNAKDKGVRKTRKKDTGDEDDSVTPKSVEVVDENNEIEMIVDNESTSGSADRGSRDAPRKTPLDLMAEDEAKRLANYQLAVTRAAETSKMNPLYNPEAHSSSSVLLPGLSAETTFDQGAYNERMRRELQQKAQTQVGIKRAIAMSAIDWEDDDQDLVQALAKSRRLALQQRKIDDALTEGSGGGDVVLSRDAYMEQRGAERVARAVAELQATSKPVISRSLEEQAADGEEEEGIDAEGRRADGTLVFNSTTEFTTRLQAGLNEKARLKTEAAMLDLERTAFASASSSASLSRMVAEDMDDDEEDIYGERNGAEESHDENGSDEDSEDDDQMAFLHRQPLVAKGMAATLALLKGSGELKTTEALAGRAKDRRTVDPSANDFNVKLEYRDDTGRKLTQKEAFRQLSYRFHGYGPGQKKKEKRLKVCAFML